MFFKLQILYFFICYQLRGTFRNRERLLRFQQRKWKRFVRKTVPKSAFYRPFIQQPLREFPLMSKELFMQHFDDINTVGIPKDSAMATALAAEESRDFSPEINQITVGLSTGTSGKRGLFLASPTERAQWVAMVLHRVLKRPLFKPQKIAFFLRANSTLYSSTASVLLQFHFFDIFRKIPDLISELEKLQPDILAAQPSVLRCLAEAARDGQLSIRPRQVISFAEVLHEDDRKLIENIFSVAVTEVYQCTEGFLGVSCAYGTMHLNEDVAIFEKEYLSPGRFVPIVTDFTRTSQPVIRYVMTDVLVERTGPCPCGSALLGIERIEGRTDDVLLFEQGGRQIRIFPDMLVRKIARATDNFSHYQLKQVANELIEVTLDAPSRDQQQVQGLIKNAILAVLETQGVQVSAVQIHFHKGEVNTPGDKHRRVIRVIKEKV